MFPEIVKKLLFVGFADRTPSTLRAFPSDELDECFIEKDTSTKPT